MKATFLLCLIATAACFEISSYHYKDGNMAINGAQSSKIAGPIFMKNQQMAIIAGTNSDRAKTLFSFSGMITSYEVTGNNFVANATCVEAVWGTTSLKGLSGTFIVTGVIDSVATFKGVCIHKQGEIATNYSISAQGTYSKNMYYTPLEAAKRATILVGQNIYEAPHVINFAVYGYPFLDLSMNCAWYLKNFKKATEAMAGYVVVGTDGKHCGIVDAEADKFVHVNPAKKVVALSSMSSLRQFFPKGYEFKAY